MPIFLYAVITHHPISPVSDTPRTTRGAVSAGCSRASSRAVPDTRLPAPDRQLRYPGHRTSRIVAWRAKILAMYSSQWLTFLPFLAHAHVAEYPAHVADA